MANFMARELSLNQKNGFKVSKFLIFSVFFPWRTSEGQRVQGPWQGGLEKPVHSGGRIHLENEFLGIDSLPS